MYLGFWRLVFGGLVFTKSCICFLCKIKDVKKNKPVKYEKMLCEWVEDNYKLLRRFWAQPHFDKFVVFEVIAVPPHLLSWALTDPCPLEGGSCLCSWTTPSKLFIGSWPPHQSEGLCQGSVVKGTETMKSKHSFCLFVWIIETTNEECGTIWCHLWRKFLGTVFYILLFVLCS